MGPVILNHMSETIAEIRNKAAASLSPKQQQQWEQFLTPMPVAEQATSLFTHSDKPVHILDLGSGTGILGAVTARQAAPGSSVLAIEQDDKLASASELSLAQVCDRTKVINTSVFNVLLNAEFDRVILNPPYKKIRPITIPTSRGELKITNLYAAFLVIAVQALSEGGECVAIIPRSWMNGAYFKDFRKWLLDECSLDVIAVYGSRQEHFKDMSILQEIMLLKVSKRPQTRSVTIYGNITPVRSLGSQPSVQASLDSITLGRDRILCIQQQDSRLSEFKSLEAQGLWVSTGKLVWFRNRDLLSENKPVDGYPLYWADNQNGLMTQHPIECDREQWVTSNATDRNVLLPAGDYCIVNRFSAKEQLHRIHASYLSSNVEFAADNKLNYIHQGTSRKTIPLNSDVARGLTLWLSTTIIDNWYRQISGSTQVNATDLRQLPCPSKEQLIQLSRLIPTDVYASQSLIDQTVGGLFLWTKAS